jgi:hypothetical protein
MCFLIGKTRRTGIKLCVSFRVVCIEQKPGCGLNKLFESKRPIKGLWLTGCNIIGAYETIRDWSWGLEHVARQKDSGSPVCSEAEPNIRSIGISFCFCNGPGMRWFRAGRLIGPGSWRPQHHVIRFLILLVQSPVP